MKITAIPDDRHKEIREGIYVNRFFSQKMKPLSRKEKVRLKTDLNNNRHRERWMRRK